MSATRNDCRLALFGTRGSLNRDVTGGPEGTSLIKAQFQALASQHVAFYAERVPGHEFRSEYDHATYYSVQNFKAGALVIF
jgi:hypothetical protein